MQGIEIDSYYSRPGFERMHPFTERTSEQKKEQEIYLENAKEKYYIEGGKKIYYLKGAVVRGIDKRRPRISVQGTLYDSAEIIHVQTHPVAAFHGQNLSDEYANRDEKPDLLFAIQRIYDPGCLLCKNRP